MKLAALICGTLLAYSSICLAASPDELWHQYQEHPSTVSTVPTKPEAEAKTAPHITVETTDGDIVTPGQPAIASKQAPQADATAIKDGSAAVQEATAPTADNPLDTKEATEPAVNETAKKTAADVAAANKAKTTATEQTTIVKETADNPVTAKTPMVSNKPVTSAAKPKPKPNLVGRPPLPKQYLRTPQAGDFTTITNAPGGYSLAVPNGFGTDPLAQLPGTEGSMLIRTATDTLMFAANVLDADDVTSYKATEPLPAYADANLYCAWQHPGGLNWDCRLSRHNDYHGDKLLLQAQTQQADKTYQLLFVMPKAKQDIYLPQALYSLHSFKLL